MGSVDALGAVEPDSPPPPARPGHWLTRFLILRLLGLVYLMAFLTWVNQGPALFGSHGLLPAASAFERVEDALGSRRAAFWQEPSLFWLADGDRFLFGAGWLGVGISILLLAGYGNALALLVLLVLQVSVLPAGQTFYSFGWELQLVETGFLALFLVPLLDGRPFPRRPPSLVAIWLFRWLIVRIMWGAGLIKLRGDPCWRDLTCLDFHFQTQPVPNPLSPWFHGLPAAAHRAGVLFNHVAELLAPFFVFGPRRVRHVAGAVMATLQLVLLASGNLSFLNWLTLVPILACFDDGVWSRILPRRLVAHARRAAAVATPSRAQSRLAQAAAIVVAVLSVPVMINLASGEQAMNTSFTRLPLVNTYGAFGSVGRERNELVFEGTSDATVTPSTRWTPYAFKCKPGDPARRPCWMSPYHYRLDWLMWFAAMRGPGDYPFVAHFVWKLLRGDPATVELLAGDPFAGTPPHFVRVELYRYEMATPPAKVWWTRTRLAEWLPPLSLDHAGLRRFLEAKGWDSDAPPPAGALDRPPARRE